VKRAPVAIAEQVEGAKPLSRSRKSADKRDAIMRAAIEVINAKSFALATMSEIAATLDLRDATLYYYFPNKQALVYACHVRSLERFETSLRKADGGNRSGAEKLKWFVHDFLDDSARHGAQLYFGDYSYLEAPKRGEIHDWGERLKVMLEAFIKQGIADGSVVECESGAVVQLLLGMIIWLGKWVPEVHDMTVNRLMDAIDAFCFHGLESRQDLGGSIGPTA
jgi:TetR/AcrR family transcriptional regulator